MIDCIKREAPINKVDRIIKGVKNYYLMWVDLNGLTQNRTVRRNQGTDAAYALKNFEYFEKAGL